MLGWLSLEEQGLATEMAADSFRRRCPGEEKLEGDFAVEVLMVAPRPIFSLIR
jgi:hypothetical protein